MIKPVPARFSGAIAPTSQWLFCLKEGENYIWAFPGWENNNFTKPYHYVEECRRKQAANLDSCKHKPPKAYIKIWKLFLNLKMPMFIE